MLVRLTFCLWIRVFLIRVDSVPCVRVWDYVLGMMSRCRALVWLQSRTLFVLAIIMA